MQKVLHLFLNYHCGNHSLCRNTPIYKSNLAVVSFSNLPSHKIVPMPSLSPTMESGSIAKWNIKEGERFEAGMSLCDVETDKATVSFDATDEGYLAKILVGSGDIKVGQPLMITVDEAADLASFKDFKLSSTSKSEPILPSSQVVPPPSVPLSSVPLSEVVIQSKSSSNDRIFASPLAKKLIRETDSTLQLVKSVVGNGSGSRGRITAEDVLKAAAVPKTTSASSNIAQVPPAAQKVISPAPSATPISKPAVTTTGVYADFELSDLARRLAASQTNSKHVIPHYYVSVEMNLTELLKVRQQFNAKLIKEKKPSKDGKPVNDEDNGLSVLDFLIKAAAVAIKQVPDVNASWMDTFIRRYDQVDINLLMGSGSLIATPVLKNVGSMGLASISEELNNFEKVLFNGSEEQIQQLLSNESKMAVGTFSIHNLGMYGVKSAAPIILNPQAGALALGAIIDTVVPRVKSSGAENEPDWDVAPIMIATLSVDHRVVDGAVSAQWLSAFKQLVENPMNLLL